jgi:cell division protein FtsL
MPRHCIRGPDRALLVFTYTIPNLNSVSRFILSRVAHKPVSIAISQPRNHVVSRLYKVLWKLWVKLIQCVVVLFKYTITWLLTLNQKLRELQTHVAAMKASCNEAETQLALTNESSKMLLERANNLRDER